MKKTPLILVLLAAASAAIAQPGPTPNPWQQSGSTLYYNLGGITLPSTVTGGTKGVGTINAQGYYLNGTSLPTSVFGRTGAVVATSGDYSFPLISGTAAVSQGGTGLTGGTSGGVPYFSTTSTIASSAALTANAIVLGGGAGGAPASLGSLGTATTVLHGNASGAPTWSAVDLTADVSGILPGANGGTANGFFAVSGPASSVKTFTFPNASATVLTTNALVTVAQGGTGANTLTGLVVGNGTSAMTAYAGASCTNQFIRSLSAAGAATCATVANADLANSSMTIGGASTALGDTVTATTILDSIGSTRGSILYRGASGWAILTPGTSGYVLKSQGAGADPIWSTIAGQTTLTSNSANAFAVGPNGATNPSFNVDASTSSAATGINVKSAAAGGGAALSVISSGTNENLTIDAKGTGTTTIGTNSTGNIVLNRAVVANSTITASNGNVTGLRLFNTSLADFSYGLNITQGNAGGLGTYYFANFTGGTNGSITNNSSVTVYATTSDERLKNWQIPQHDYRSKIERLWVGDFIWKASGQPGFGVRAQQAYAVLGKTSGISPPRNPKDTWSASSEPFGFLALKGVKGIYRDNDRQEAKIARLEKQVADLTRAVNALRTKH